MSSGRSDRVPRKVKKALKEAGQILLHFHMEEGLYERVVTFAQINAMSPVPEKWFGTLQPLTRFYERNSPCINLKTSLLLVAPRIWTF